MNRYFVILLVILHVTTKRVVSYVTYYSQRTIKRYNKSFFQSSLTCEEDIDFSEVETFPCTVPVVPSCNVWPHQAAKFLKQNGVCILLTKEDDILHTNVKKAADSRLEELKRRIRNRGMDPEGQEDGPFRFTEVVCRDEGGLRYDMPVPWKNNYDLGTPLTPMESQAISDFHHQIETTVQPVLNVLWNNKDDDDTFHAVSSGFLINQPGSLHQGWHRDGPKEGMMNVFCPLIDLKAELGPTEVWSSTHTDETSKQKEESNKVAPLLKRGQLLLMDYRTLHRGLGNESKDTTRTVAYTVFEKDNDSGGDKHNFPDALTLEYD